MRGMPNIAQVCVETSYDKELGHMGEIKFCRQNNLVNHKWFGEGLDMKNDEVESDVLDFASVASAVVPDYSYMEWMT